MADVIARWEGTANGWKASQQPPGTWYALPLGPHPDFFERTLHGVRVIIYVTCPLCKKCMTLAHAISEDGTLHPSMVCGHGCGWHVWARLADWTGGAMPTTKIGPK